MFRRSVLLAAAISLAALPRAARAQAWPAGPVRLVVPYPPGGTTDALARPLAQRMSEAWGQPVVVDNRPGASGVLGADIVARAAADGTTLLVTTQQTQVMNNTLLRRLPHDPATAFTPISLIASTPHALVVPAASPARDVAGLVSLGRTRPLSFASSSAGSAAHLLGETFSRTAGLGATHVPYRGVAPATTDLLAGTVDFMFATWPGVSALARDGRLRALAAASAVRLPDAPDVPTMAQQGYAELGADAWFGIYGPAGLPRDVAQRINAATRETFADAALKSRLEGAGFRIRTMTLEEFAAFNAEELRRWTAIIRTAGVTLED
jgi:tripartite-type tricarboxylate transporter receptor subunit TctC